MSNITLEEILKSKAFLEEALLNAIKDFEDITDLEVSDIHVSRTLILGSRRPLITGVTTKVTL
jgi:hypothetical protein